jgi:hypothetical protein
MSNSSPPSGKDDEKPHLIGQSHTDRTAAAHMLPSFLAGPKVTINKLPDDILLAISDYCRGDNEYFAQKKWKPLVHVCQRWRCIFLISPRRLQLLFVGDARIPLMEIFNIWPPLPIAVRYSPNEEEGEGNVIAALDHRCRISWIIFKELASHVLERFTAVM